MYVLDVVRRCVMWCCLHFLVSHVCTVCCRVSEMKFRCMIEVQTGRLLTVGVLAAIGVRCCTYMTFSLSSHLVQPMLKSVHLQLMQLLSRIVKTKNDVEYAMMMMMIRHYYRKNQMYESYHLHNHHSLYHQQ